MSNRFSSNNKALAECDICGFRYKLRELRSLIVRGRDTNTKACTECWSSDHPQNRQGMYPVDDPQAIRDPRPDFAGYATSRAQIYSGSQFNKLSFVTSASVGQVTVTTS
jgi:hypothetical protein|tara:strand:- start:268 stop:594 length:327 start_codon:yes stop_codon:yes gene_type:complete